MLATHLRKIDNNNNAVTVILMPLLQIKNNIRETCLLHVVILFLLNKITIDVIGGANPKSLFLLMFA